MRPTRFLWIVISALCALLTWSGNVHAQVNSKVELQIRLRAGDGTALTGEPVALQRMPAEDNPILDCTTDTDGSCAWVVERGLYQLLFERPLDSVSSLALAEGGLRGFGLTVGDMPISYHFTLHSDGRAYFDAAPDAAIPRPYIPDAHELHGGAPATTVVPLNTEGPLASGVSPVLAVPTATIPSPVASGSVVVTTTLEVTVTPDSAASGRSDSSWHILLFISLGLVIGGGLHLFWPRSSSNSDPLQKQSWGRWHDQAEPHASEEESTDA